MMYHYTFGGLRNVWLVNGYKVTKTPHGDAVAFTDGEGLDKAICSALASKEGMLTGAELRFLRLSGFMVSQPALGRLIGIDGQSIARWEKSKLPRWADRLVRLLYSAKADGNQPICRAVERLQTVERLVKQRIVMREQQGEWVPKVKDDTEQDAQPRPNDAALSAPESRHRAVPRAAGTRKRARQHQRSVDA